MTIPESEILKLLVMLATGGLGVLVALVGWLLNRSIAQLDAKIDGLKASQDTHTSDLSALRDRVTRLETRAELSPSHP